MTLGARRALNSSSSGGPKPAGRNFVSREEADNRCLPISLVVRGRSPSRAGARAINASVLTLSRHHSGRAADKSMRRVCQTEAPAGTPLGGPRPPWGVGGRPDRHHYGRGPRRALGVPTDTIAGRRSHPTGRWRGELRWSLTSTTLGAPAGDAGVVHVVARVAAGVPQRARMHVRQAGCLVVSPPAAIPKINSC